MTVRDLMMHMSGLGMAAGRTLAQVLLDSDRGIAPGARRGPNATLALDGGALRGLPAAVPARHAVAVLGGRSTSAGGWSRSCPGKPLDEYLRETIFGPLGMPDTAFYVPDDKLGRFAACYRRDESKKLVLVDDPSDSAYRERADVLLRRRRAGLAPLPTTCASARCC